MKVLAFDSSGLVASVAILSDETLLAEYTVNFKKTHSQTLLPMLDEIVKMTELDLNEIDGIAVAAGPGSFTGLRIGSATAKGLGLALNKRIVAVPTVDALAYNIVGTDKLICPMMDAKRNQVYTGIYRWNESELIAISEQKAVAAIDMIDEINGLGKPVILLGDGVPAVYDVIRENLKVPYEIAPCTHNRQRAALVGLLGLKLLKQGKTEDAREHEPVYLRLSQAERELSTNLKEHIIIREMKPEDLQSVAEIEKENFSDPWSENAFHESIKHENNCFLVAETKGVVVGYCGFVGVLDEAQICNVSVESKFHRQGIGQLMMQKLISGGITRGIKAFTLEVRVSNKNAIALYEKLGFVSEGVRKGFYSHPKEDANIMWYHVNAK